MPRWSALLVVAALCAACSSPLLHDLDEAEANQVLAVLQQRGIPAEKVRSQEGNRATYRILVGRSQASAAWQLLRLENLPRPRPPGVSELFGKPGLVPTATQERTLMHHALSGELSRTLQALDGVLEARVHLVLPARDPLSPPDAPPPSPRAAVLMRVSAARGALDVGEVRQLVSGSVEGLRPEAVSVLVSRASAAAPPAPGSSQLVRLGPFLVAGSSRAGLRAVMAGGLGLLLVLCLALMVVVRRYRALRRAAAAGAPASAQGQPPASLESSLGLLSRSLAARPGARPRPSPGQNRGPET